MVEGKKVDFGPDAINQLFGLEAKEIEHAIFKNPQERDLEDALKRVAWPRTKWDIMPTGKYQLFLQNLNTEAIIWLVFVKNDIRPTRHDSTISMEHIMLVYCIMEHLLVNIVEIISEHIIAWVKHPRRTRPFSHLIEKLCLKACPTSEQLA
ncbi:hypothetical protein E5676_scaffold416G00290 [Cucumis melo var. makuwa]|nr:hypothetical protein E6C27_scaffold43054G00260 [Cucumis melo var. makuwa]TYK19535.1 hypothetical protein E5676_scaffold416G00290 [Cucumis melo var. makuwa]